MSPLGVTAIATLALAGSLQGQWQILPMHPAGALGSRIYAVDSSGRSYGGTFSKTLTDAAVWQGIQPEPQSWGEGNIYGVRGSQKIGLAGGAALWTDGPASLVHLQPAGYYDSTGFASSGSSQVGEVFATASSSPRAALWHGTAASFVPLHPAGADSSSAVAAFGSQQGGQVLYVGARHAALWSGSAASFVDMNPPGALESWITGMAQGQQAGWASFGNSFHAGMWRGTPGSFTDMNPPGAILSEILATCGDAQVGWAAFGFAHTPGVWFGSAESFVPLPIVPGYFEFITTSIVFDGTQYRIGGYGVNNSGYPEAFLWVGIPAPGAATALALGLALAARRRR
jgi:hypothetical protein